MTLTYTHIYRSQTAENCTILPATVTEFNELFKKYCNIMLYLIVLAGFPEIAAFHSILYDS